MKVDWQVVRSADGADPKSRDWQNLQHLVGRVIPDIEKELLTSEKPVLLVNNGLLARYDQMALLERLRDQVGRPGNCPAMFVLVAGDKQSEQPLLDGKVIPLIAAGQRTPVPESWIQNAHRAKATTP